MTLLDAPAPPSTRGLARDEVRLLVARPGVVQHRRFTDLPGALDPGDLVVVNTSATRPAAVDAVRPDGRPAVVHLATVLDDGDRVVEVRPAGTATGPLEDLRPGERLALPGGAVLDVLAADPPGQHRLHRARLAAPAPYDAWLAAHGRPISYAYVPEPWPLVEYQTVFADQPGSAEMPSAGRPFSGRVLAGLARRGVLVAPVVLHTGVSSQEPGEPPQPEPYAVPAATARLVDHVRASGGRVVAVGTTVTRALETAAGEVGRVRARSGWTSLVLGPARPARVVTGLVSGWHPPGASHLELLRAVAGDALVDRAYAASDGYLAHEFGDSCLLLPDR